MTTKIEQLMNKDLITLDAEASVTDAARKMRDESIGNVLVTRSGELCGIVTDRDLVVRCLAEGGEARKARLGDLCTKDLVTLSVDASAEDAVELMRENAVRRVPVVDHKKPVGIVSLGDLAMTLDDSSALGRISAARPNG